MCDNEAINGKLEKPEVKNVPSSFKRLWALQVPSLQNKVDWDNWDDWENYYIIVTIVINA